MDYYLIHLKQRLTGTLFIVLSIIISCSSNLKAFTPVSYNTPATSTIFSEFTLNDLLSSQYKMISTHSIPYYRSNTKTISTKVISEEMIFASFRNSYNSTITTVHNLNGKSRTSNDNYTIVENCVKVSTSKLGYVSISSKGFSAVQTRPEGMDKAVAEIENELGLAQFRCQQNLIFGFDKTLTIHRKVKKS